MGWCVRQSVLMELDFVLVMTRRSEWITAVSSDLAELITNVPADWQQQWPELLGEAHEYLSLFADLGAICGVLLEPDYQIATLAIRDMTVDDALIRLQALLNDHTIPARPSRDPAEQLAELVLHMHQLGRARLGLPASEPEGSACRLHSDVFRIPRILRGGDLHARFWHWLDRFYYGYYAPWRDGRATVLATLEQHAVAMLGAHAGTQPPRLDWLPPQNPLVYVSEVREVAQANRIEVCFWVEPFGLFDGMSITPDLLIVSFAEPGALYQNFRRYSETIAQRTHALADPTRLTILRLIRYTEMNNTDIGAFLEVSRPTVSVHARILREAGLIETRQEGREARHAIVPAAVYRLFRDLRLFLDLPQDENQPNGNDQP